MITDERKAQLTSLCQELIRRPGISGEEDQVVELIKSAFKTLGYDEWFVDDYGNVMGRIKGKRGGRAILFDSHIDTVPVLDDSKWIHAPFGGEIEDGRMYGRGASDMKGAVSAMIAAAAYFAQDTDKSFFGDIYVSGTVHQERFEGVAARKISERINPDYVVIGEASELNLKIGQRGRAEIVIETFGKPAHSANPEKGINAVYKMANIINKIHDIEISEHPILGKGILVLTDIKSYPYPGTSIVPSRCRATFDRRVLIGETKESVLESINNLIDRLKMKDSELEVKVYYAEGEERCFTREAIQCERFFPAWLFAENDGFVQAAIRGLESSGINPETSYYSFCTNGSHYAGEKGIKTIGFGPSSENLIHIIDEYIELEQLYKGAEGYYGILKSVFNR